MNRVYVGLGSNINNPILQLHFAIVELMTLEKVQWIGVSSFYKSKPVGPQDQPDFINAVAVIETNLSPLDLLGHFQVIENNQGRVKTRHWGERSIDLDILLYADLVVDTPDLTIPHPEMQNRAFVLTPLNEVRDLYENCNIPG